MYHHNYQSKNNLLSSRSAFHLERHLFLQGGNAQGDSGLVLSTDAKPRLKWTPELHERFIEAVNQLGGADKATPKTIMRLMGIPGLTLYHLKSHLQKYRLSKNLQAQFSTGTSKNSIGFLEPADKAFDIPVSIINNTDIMAQTNNTTQISEALQMQIEVQKRLHEQLEVQRHLQLRIEAQGKYLQSVLEKAQETLGKQNLGSQGLEAAKAQLSELVSRVSNEYLNNTFSGLKEFPCLQNMQAQTAQLADCSMDSCLTSLEGPQKDREINNLAGLEIRQGHTPVSIKQIREFIKLEQPQTAWGGIMSTCNTIPRLRDSPMTTFPNQTGSDDLSISFPEKLDNWHKRRETDDLYHDRSNSKKSTGQQEKEGPSKMKGLTNLAAKLDLNVQDDNDNDSNCKQFDLNGFSWS